MSYELTANAKILVDQVGIKPNICLKIAGIDEIFGQVEVFKTVKIGDPDLFIDGSWTIGGKKPHEYSTPWISQKKTSREISQQLLQDKGGTSSISKVNIEIIDKDHKLVSIFQPGNNVDDILSAEATVHMGFQDGSYPQDYIEIFSGVIDTADFGASSAVISVAHPDQRKRRELFIQSISKIVGAIDSITGTMNIEDSQLLILPTVELKTYILIEQELIQYTGISGNTLTGCIRGQENTIASSHDDESETQSYYVLTGKPIETALKVMLSDETNSNIEENISVTGVNYITGVSQIDGAYFFNEENIQYRLGLVTGDLITVTNSLSDFANEPIIGFGINEIGSYILIAPTGRPSEIEAEAIATIKSKYNVLSAGAGLGMKTYQVDIEGHEFQNTLFGTGFPTYDLKIKDTIEGKELIEAEIYHPSGLYSLPRKGRSGVGYTSPPLAITEIKTLDESNIRDPQTLRIKRSINKWFYNNIIYKFELDSIEDKYLDNKVTLSADSVSRIKTGNKSLTIKSSGLRSNPITKNLIDRVTRNLLNRYQFASDYVQNVRVMPSVGFNIEVGDVVIFGSANLKLADNAQGNREFKPRLMEVVNKKLNVNTLDIALDLLDTNFGVDTRFSVISPSSIIASGSTTTVIRLKQSFSTPDGVFETNKWLDFIGNPLAIHSNDWSFQEISTYKIHPTIPNAILLDDALSIAPDENYILDPAPYNEAGPAMKTMFASFNPEIYIVNGNSSTSFDVSVSDALILFKDSVIRVHNTDFSNDSGQVKIESIVGQTITCKDLGFTPSSLDIISLIGFISDKGSPYSQI